MSCMLKVGCPGSRVVGRSPPATGCQTEKRHKFHSAVTERALYSNNKKQNGREECGSLRCLAPAPTGPGLITGLWDVLRTSQGISRTLG
ncbi:hypothetical protein ACLKA6_003542 [Drosophila palustris]